MPRIAALVIGSKGDNACYLVGLDDEVLPLCAL